MISACEKGLRWEFAMAMLPMAKIIGPDTTTYNALISSCRAEAQWARAFGFLEDMRTSRVLPNTITFGALVGASKHWTHALHFLTEAIRLNLPPTPLTYSSAIGALSEAALWEKSLALLSEMQWKLQRSNVIAYGAVISGCERSQQWSQVL